MKKQKKSFLYNKLFFSLFLLCISFIGFSSASFNLIDHNLSGQDTNSVGTTRSVRLIFDDIVDGSHTNISDNISIKEERGTNDRIDFDKTLKIESSGYAIEISAPSEWNGEKNYEIKIKDSFESLDGATLSEEKIITFTTDNSNAYQCNVVDRSMRGAPKDNFVYGEYQNPIHPNIFNSDCFFGSIKDTDLTCSAGENTLNRRCQGTDNNGIIGNGSYVDGKIECNTDYHIESYGSDYQCVYNYNSRTSSCGSKPANSIWTDDGQIIQYQDRDCGWGSRYETTSSSFSENKNAPDKCYWMCDESDGYTHDTNNDTCIPRYHERTCQSDGTWSNFNTNQSSTETPAGTFYEDDTIYILDTSSNNIPSSYICTPSPCDLPRGGTIDDGDDVTAYESSSVACGDSCSSQTRTCHGGTLDGSYTNQSCEEDCPDSCTLPRGGTINDGESVPAYLASSVACGSSCQQETRTCSDGTLDGSYTNQSCGEDCPSSCSLPRGGTINDGESVTGYLTSSVACGDSCSSQTRTCNDGTLDGSYTNQSCGEDCPSSCSLPRGGTINDGESVTGYLTSSVACGDSCSSQTRTCNDGILDGSYTNQSCSAPCNECNIAANETINGYKNFSSAFSLDHGDSEINIEDRIMEDTTSLVDHGDLYCPVYCDNGNKSIMGLEICSIICDDGYFLQESFSQLANACLPNPTCNNSVVYGCNNGTAINKSRLFYPDNMDDSKFTRDCRATSANETNPTDNGCSFDCGANQYPDSTTNTCIDICNTSTTPGSCNGGYDPNNYSVGNFRNYYTYDCSAYTYDTDTCSATCSSGTYRNGSACESDGHNICSATEPGVCDFGRAVGSADACGETRRCFRGTPGDADYSNKSCNIACEPDPCAATTKDGYNIPAGDHGAIQILEKDRTSTDGGDKRTTKYECDDGSRDRRDGGITHCEDGYIFDSGDTDALNDNECIKFCEGDTYNGSTLTKTTLKLPLTFPIQIITTIITGNYNDKYEKTRRTEVNGCDTDYTTEYGCGVCDGNENPGREAEEGVRGRCDSRYSNPEDGCSCPDEDNDGKCDSEPTPDDPICVTDFSCNSTIWDGCQEIPGLIETKFDRELLSVGCSLSHYDKDYKDYPEYFCEVGTPIGMRANNSIDGTFCKNTITITRKCKNGNKESNQCTFTSARQSNKMKDDIFSLFPHS